MQYLLFPLILLGFLFGGRSETPKPKERIDIEESLRTRVAISEPYNYILGKNGKKIDLNLTASTTPGYITVSLKTPSNTERALLEPEVWVILSFCPYNYYGELLSEQYTNSGCEKVTSVDIQSVRETEIKRLESYNKKVEEYNTAHGFFNPN